MKKRSDNSYDAQKAAILRAFNYMKKNVDQITGIDMYNYFKDGLDKAVIKIGPNSGKPLANSTKIAYRSYIKSFFDYIQFQYFERGLNYSNPVPSKNVFDFSIDSSDIKSIKAEKIPVFSDKELISLLDKAKSKAKARGKASDLRDFIFFGLLTCCGMRLVEYLTIRIKDIDLPERLIETGFIKNARKSTRMTRKALLFFVPQNFIPYLRQYINYLKTKYNTPWLFPGQSIIKPLTKNIRLYVKRNYDNNTTQYSLFHSFRKTLISRFDNMPGMQPHIIEILLNHQPTTTQGKSYIKKEPELKRKDYDSFFPFYYFPYF